MKFQLLLVCLWMLFHFTLSSPSKKIEVKLRPHLKSPEVGNELRPKVFPPRAKRQIENLDPSNQNVADTRPQRQLFPNDPNNPEIPVDQFLTSGELEDVDSTIENFVTSSTSPIDGEYDVTTLPNVTTDPSTTIKTISDKNSLESTSDLDTAHTTLSPDTSSSAHTETIFFSSATTFSPPATIFPFTNLSVTDFPTFSLSVLTTLEEEGTFPSTSQSVTEFGALNNSSPTTVSPISSNDSLTLPSISNSSDKPALFISSSSVPSALNPSTILLITRSSSLSSHTKRNGLTARDSTLENNNIEPAPSAPTMTLKTKFPVQKQDERTLQSRDSASNTNSTDESTETATETDSEPRPLYPFSVQDGDEDLLQLNNEANCNFGDDDAVNLCQWENLPLSLETWTVSKGLNFGLLGGPPEDNTDQSDEGGYAIYNARKKVSTPFSQSLLSDSAMLISPVLPPTDGIGQCIDFWYAMEGLSQDRLRILLRPPSPTLFGGNRHQNLSNELFALGMRASDGQGDIVLWENRDSTNGKWINGQVVYSLNDRHMIIFEGLPVGIQDAKRSFRGYISLDDFNFMEASLCKPFCNFEGGYCSWSQDTNDDFDWSLSQGSVNPSTGPIMDRFSFNYNDYGITGGAYAFIDSGYPRKPKDKARLLSEIFSPPSPDAPLCMRFWTHMYGNGVGSLRIIILSTQGDEEIIWELKGEQGNNWYQGQVTISAVSDFQIVIEAEVGKNNLGDIAIDEIALKENACPTSPQSASKFKVDCTFEVDECGWRNVEFRQRVDELDWERAVASQARLPNSDHTLKSSQGTFMTLPRNTVQRGERGWLVSNPLQSSDVPLCLSFWYFMFDPLIEATGPSLGSFMVILMEQDDDQTQTMTPIWRLKNQQGPDWNYGQTSIKTDKTFMILFEGLWGNSKGSEYIALDDITLFTGECSNVPEKAEVSFLDCDFTRDSCAYMNVSSGRSAQWMRSSIQRRPRSLDDHTYGGPGGYIYFDIFSKTADAPPKVTLMSRVIEESDDGEPICLSFWYAASSDDRDAKLTIYREPADSRTNDAESSSPEATGLMVWSVRAAEVYEGRIEWFHGQTQIASNSDFKLTFIGEARVGGFAIDDIEVYPGTCRTRPPPRELLPSK